jgi:hypothetical protein
MNIYLTIYCLFADYLFFFRNAGRYLGFRDTFPVV